MIFQNINLFLDSYFCAIGFLLTKMFQLVLIMSRKEKKQEISKFAWHFPCFFSSFFTSRPDELIITYGFFWASPSAHLKLAAPEKNSFRLFLAAPKAF